MPRKEINDYTFYKISNVNGDVDLCYVGSTSNMKQRRWSHRTCCVCPKNPKYNRKVYKTIREHGGWDEFKIIEIGYAKQLTLTEAHVIEEKYRVELCADLNSQRCHTTEKEKSAYYENNKEVFSENSKIYRKNNREAIAEHAKVYRENNKEVVAKRKKVYYENNKDKIKTRDSAKITCECGCVICHSQKSKHRKSKKHINLMNNKNNIDVIHNE